MNYSGRNRKGRNKAPFSVFEYKSISGKNITFSINSNINDKIDNVKKLKSEDYAKLTEKFPQLGISSGELLFLISSSGIYTRVEIEETERLLIGVSKIEKISFEDSAKTTIFARLFIRINKEKFAIIFNRLIDEKQEKEGEK